ncbi:acyl carrier protein, partial [Streptomyces sp. ISL-1]|uniref:acyl carrier protein n=1 Tax=Streptomyces sp. ISL-1 TaxID=2817657 RepID=UPI0035AB89A1
MTADPADNLATPAECEQRFAEVLADIVGTEPVSVDSHFFDDLGADSMLMARFCARVRKQADLPSVSMPDIYKHPTTRRLAAALANDVLTADPADNLATPAKCEQRFA